MSYFLKDICTTDDGITYHINVYSDNIIGRDNNGNEKDRFNINNVETELHEKICEIAVRKGLLTRRLTYHMVR